MTKATTTAPVDQLDHDDPIAAAEASAQAARERAEQARQLQAEMAKRIAEANAQLAQAAAEEKEFEEAERQAEREKLKAEWDKLGDEPVTEPVARQLAERLLMTHEQFRQGGEDRQGNDLRCPKRYWEILDSTRLRLRTNDIDKNAQEIVLGIEALVGYADRWEDSRHKRLYVSEHAGSAEGLGPPDDRRSQAIEKELKDILDSIPPKPLESIGNLLMQGVEVRQICRILGLIDMEGQHVIQRLASIVDGAFERIGASPAQRLAVRMSGAVDFEQAWQIRERRIAQGHADHLVPGFPCVPGSNRPARGTGELNRPASRPAGPPVDRTIVVPDSGELPDDI